MAREEKRLMGEERYAEFCKKTKYYRNLCPVNTEAWANFSRDQWGIRLRLLDEYRLRIKTTPPESTYNYDEDDDPIEVKGPEPSQFSSEAPPLYKRMKNMTPSIWMKIQ